MLKKMHFVLKCMQNNLFFKEMLKTKNVSRPTAAAKLKVDS